MKITQNGDISGITVEVWATYRHHWVAGQQYHHDPSLFQNPALQCQLWLIQQGYVEFEAIGKNWRIESGEACFFSHTVERRIITPQPAAWLSLGLWITVFNKFNLMQNITLPVQWRPDESERLQMESWMERIHREFQLKDTHHRLVVSGLAHALIGVCWPFLSSASLDSAISSELPVWLAKTLQRISLDPTCNIGELAHEAGFSLAQFRRSFHQHVGCTPRAYLTSKRLEAARHYLEHTDWPLRKIIEHIGLNDSNHFSQTFKNVYGLSPSQYRALRAGENAQ